MFCIKKLITVSLIYLFLIVSLAFSQYWSSPYELNGVGWNDLQIGFYGDTLWVFWSEDVGVIAAVYDFSMETVIVRDTLFESCLGYRFLRVWSDYGEHLSCTVEWGEYPGEHMFAYYDSGEWVDTVFISDAFYDDPGPFTCSYILIESGLWDSSGRLWLIGYTDHWWDG